MHREHLADSFMPLVTLSGILLAPASLPPFVRMIPFAHPVPRDTVLWSNSQAVLATAAYTFQKPHASSSTVTSIVAWLFPQLNNSAASSSPWQYDDTARGHF